MRGALRILLSMLLSMAAMLYGCHGAPAFAQSLGRYQTCQLQTVQGQAVPGAQVYFLMQPANLVKLTPQAQVYGSASGGTVAQPLLTNGFGECAAYLAPGVYTVVYVSDVTGTLVYPDQNVAVGGGTPTAPAFSAITGGSNSSAAMVVGSGASLTPSGSGVVAATMIDGVAVTGTPLTGQAIVATSPTAASWQGVSSSGSTTPAQQYDIPYYSASGTASALAGTAVNGIVKGRSNGSPVAASSIDVGTVLQGAANCTVAGEVYAPQSNTCVSASGLAAPGVSGDLLYNNAGVVGASAATTDAAGNLSANSLGISGGTNLNTVQISTSLLNPLVVSSGATTGYQQGLALVDGSGDGLFLANDITHNQSQLGSLKSLNIIADDFTGNGPHSVSISNGSVVAASFNQEGGVGTTRLAKVYLQNNLSANCLSTDSGGVLDTGCNPSQLESATWESPPAAGFGSTTPRPVHATNGSFISASFSPTLTSGPSILITSASTGSNAFTSPIYVRGAGGASDYNAAVLVDNGNPAVNGGIGFPGPSSQPLISNNFNLFSSTGITMQLDDSIGQGTGCFHVADGTNNWNLFSVCGNGSTNSALSTTTVPGTLNGFQGVFSNLTSGNCVQASTGGLLTTTGSPCGSGGGSAAFSGLTSGTNTSAAMVVSSGASLGVAGSGTINATTLGGATFAAPGAIGGTTAGAGTFTTLTTSGQLSLAAGSNAIVMSTTGGPLFVGSPGLAATGAATNVANFNSTPLNWYAVYWNGTVSSSDIWSEAAVMGAGPNPTSTLAFTHSGSPGASKVTVPAFAVIGITGSTQCVQADTNGNLSGTGSPCGSGGSSTAFSALTSGTNTTAAMLVGSGGSLGVTGSGTINATTLSSKAITGSGAAVTTGPTSSTNGDCVQFTGTAGQIADAGAPCGTGGSGVTLQTNGTNNTSQSTLNFITSTTNATGLTVTPSNPGTSSEKMEITGTINAANVATLNQNTTGSAATLTTARSLAGNSFNGSANIAFANKFIVQGTTDSGLSGAQFLGALGTGLLKNTTTTGVLSIATPGTDYFVSPMTTLGDILYQNATPAATRLAGNTTATKNFLCQTGTGSVSAAPVWCTIAAGDLPIATTGAFGAVKPDGTTITISSGVISVASVADTSITVSTTAIAANSCDAGHTATMTGVTTAMTFSVTPATDVASVNGWGPGTSGLYIQPWPTSNTFNYKVCNSSSSSITPGTSVTFNVSAR